MKVSSANRAALARVSVVPMRRRHLRGIMAIETQVYPRPWSLGLFDRELARPDTRRYVVALAPTRRWGSRSVVGYAGLILQQTGDPGPEAHVTTVAVDPRQHRRKIGTHLMIQLLRTARTAGAASATLEVRAANRGAQRLYSSFGFAPLGVRPRYYEETGEDAVIMWLYDLQSDEVGARIARQEARLLEPGGASGAPDDPVPWVQGRIGLVGRRG